MVARISVCQLHYAVHYLFVISEWISPLGISLAVVIFAVLLTVVVVAIVFALRAPFKSIMRFSGKTRHYLATHLCIVARQFNELRK